MFQLKEVEELAHCSVAMIGSAGMDQEIVPVNKSPEAQPLRGTETAAAEAKAIEMNFIKCKGTNCADYKRNS